MKRIADARGHLARLHGRGERVEAAAKAVVMVIGGAVACMKGLGGLLDAISPPPSEPDED